MFQTEEGRAVDPKDVDCLSKYINHSCEPNCLAEVWNVSGHERIRLVAAQDIRKSDPLEISYHTSPTRTGNCLCGSENCQFRPVNDEVKTAPKVQTLQGLRDHEEEDPEKEDPDSRKFDCHQPTSYASYLSLGRFWPLQFLNPTTPNSSQYIT